MMLYTLVWILGVIAVIALFLLLWGTADRGSPADANGQYTFILLVFNQEDRIEGLIRELRRLRNRYPTFDLVVVDQGSTDHTAKMLERLWRENEDFEWTTVNEGEVRRGSELVGLHNKSC